MIINSFDGFDNFHLGLTILLGLILILYGFEILEEEKSETEIYQLGIDIGISRTTSPCEFKEMLESGEYDYELSEQMKGLLEVVKDC